jgi:hypothetical protein
MRLDDAFVAGCFGGLVNSLVIWLSGHYHLTIRLGVRLAPSVSLPWLYPRIVWGGIWGLLFLLPLWRGSILKRGILLSLGPTLVQLFIIFPHQLHRGMLGADLGTLTPLFVFIFNAFWGIGAALWMRMSGD